MSSKDTKPATSVALFQEKTVRRVWYQEKWFFSVIDVIAILTDSENPRRYWSDLKRKLVAEGYSEVYEKIVQLKMQAPDGLTAGKKKKSLQKGEEDTIPKE
jgi:hypothetical protein